MQPFLHKFIIGLTGGIGSGKTAVSNWFATQGIDIVDADVISRTITAKGSPILTELQKAFGADIVVGGELDRVALRGRIFNNPNAVARLNAITHPAIRAGIHKELSKTKSPYVILSVPLLLESIKGEDKGLTALCQRILVVDVPVDVQIKRASQRDGQSQQQILDIISRQIDRATRLAYADDVVDNSGDLEALYAQLAILHDKYLTLVDKSL
ncbi:dephospho-CoA kinase [Moraxella oblonga]|uniref:dephospho-CoA kinase n=1 Tax=Moraxella oblonga TaxID=200413 RepID=UPI000835FEE9|nr:dephospho-CoA kinase [Moraxella oblonga]